MNNQKLIKAMEACTYAIIDAIRTHSEISIKLAHGQGEYQKLGDYDVTTLWLKTQLTVVENE